MSDVETETLFNRLTAENLHMAIQTFRANPQFSFAGLKQLHDDTFYPDPNLPNEVLDKMKAYYPMRPQRDDWKKTRNDVTPFPYDTFYSSLEKGDFQRADAAIQQALSSHGVQQKIENLANVYAELDFLHAFWDGNSRINRAFVRELARHLELEVDYTQITHKEMYVARDKSLINMNLTRRAEALKSLTYIKPNPYKSQQDTLQELERYYPNVNLLNLFKKMTE